MSSKRRRLNWQYDDEKQQFTTPSGRTVTLQEIAQLLQDQVICHHDFQGDWLGWRMRGDTLIPPGASKRGPKIKPHNAAAFARWASADERSHTHPSNAPAGRPRLYLAYTRSRS